MKCPEFTGTSAQQTGTSVNIQHHGFQIPRQCSPGTPAPFHSVTTTFSALKSFKQAAKLRPIVCKLTGNNSSTARDLFISLSS